MTSPPNSNLTTTLIIATYNDAEFLLAAVESVLAGDRVPNEIIVVDDGSSGDQVPEALGSVVTKCPRLQIIRQRNLGPSVARNLGIRQASSDLVGFLDADDTLTSSSISHRVALFSGQPGDCAGVYGSFVVMGNSRAKRFREGYGSLEHDHVGKLGGFPGGAPAYLFRREALLSVGGFDPLLKMNEDFDLVLRLSVAGYSFAGDSYPAFVRNRRPDSHTRGGDPFETHERTISFLRKARALGLLSEREICRREKAALLKVALSRRAAGGSPQEVRSIVSRAFDASPPEGIKETVAGWYSGVFRRRRSFNNELE